MPNKPWLPRMYDEYYYIAFQFVCSKRWYHDKDDILHWENDNCFQIEEMAKEKVKKSIEDRWDDI